MSQSKAPVKNAVKQPEAPSVPPSVMVEPPPLDIPKVLKVGFAQPVSAGNFHRVTHLGSMEHRELLLEATVDVVGDINGVHIFLRKEDGTLKLLAYVPIYNISFMVFE